MRFNYRAKKEARLWQTYKIGTLFATIMMFVGTFLVMCFPDEILSLFSASQEMHLLGITAMRIMSLGFVFSGLSTMIATYKQATDKVVPSIIIQLCRQGVLLIPLMWLLNHTLQIIGIWIAFPITELLVCVFACLLMQKERKNIHTTK